MNFLKKLYFMVLICSLFCSFCACETSSTYSVYCNDGIVRELTCDEMVELNQKTPTYENPETLVTVLTEVEGTGTVTNFTNKFYKNVLIQRPEKNYMVNYYEYVIEIDNKLSIVYYTYEDSNRNITWEKGDKVRFSGIIKKINNEGILLIPNCDLDWNAVYGWYFLLDDVELSVSLLRN